MRFVPSDLEVQRIWPNGYFRLFLSHVSKHQAAAAALKKALRVHGVDAFVAHMDVEPSLEWQKEIELALRSMHALAALLTPEFHASDWTDQETGWALGRGLLVLPVRLPNDPYGFAGKVQGVRGNLEAPSELAASIVEVLLANPQTHGEMRRALVPAFRTVGSFQEAFALRDHIVEVTDFTEEEKTALRNICTENHYVADAYYVPSAIYKVVGKPPAPAPAVKEPGDDGIPF